MFVICMQNGTGFTYSNVYTLNAYIQVQNLAFLGQSAKISP